jgi:hypothetical protein
MVIVNGLFSYYLYKDSMELMKSSGFFVETSIVMIPSFNEIMHIILWDGNLISVVGRTLIELPQQIYECVFINQVVLEVS